jgi:hypothetical protein
MIGAAVMSVSTKCGTVAMIHYTSSKKVSEGMNIHSIP